MTASMLLRDVELEGEVRDVRVQDGVVAAVGHQLNRLGADEVEVLGHRGALLPGLHDHHIHLLATAAAETSVACGSPRVRSRADLGVVLNASAPRNGWIRGIDYDDGTVGLLDRAALDQLRDDVPVRIQHRGGALWVFNSRGMEAAGLDVVDREGVERDTGGMATGRVWQSNGWLADYTGSQELPDLVALGSRLAALGITGVTDATPDLSAETGEILRTGLPQRVRLLGRADDSMPIKIVVAEHAVPSPERLCDLIHSARPRPVALHCVSRAALVVLIRALHEVGAVTGDRVEHAAVCPPELAAELAALGIVVVTQPSIVAMRGDDYLDRVDPEDVPFLWPYGSLVAGGVHVACSSDAPYGDLDPWRGIAAASLRLTDSGRRIGASEAVPAGVALAGYLTPLHDPGGQVRTVRVGVAADLLLLDRPLSEALAQLNAHVVAMTLIGGRLVHSRDSSVLR
ncbi:MAG: amidohydrolase family protein [bacterium]|nr:amidohydrolase family protein [bacterium]